MRLIRILGPSLVVVLVASFGVLATSASAQLRQPVWYECHKFEPTEEVEGEYTGHFMNKTCTKAATKPAKNGKYEIEPGIGPGKTLKGKFTLATLKVKTPFGEERIVCERAKIEGGFAEAPNLVTNFHVAFKKCSFAESECRSGEVKGEIRTHELQGELGWIKEESPSEVGLRVEGTTEETVEGQSERPLAEFECGTWKTNKETHVKEFSADLRASVYGQLIGVQNGDHNTLSKDLTLEYVPGEYYGTQEFEGKPYTPVVNILGWASEVEAITKAQEENKEEEHPAHVLRGVLCGSLVESLIHKECTPLAYGGLEWMAIIKGNLLMVREEEA